MNPIQLEINNRYKQLDAPEQATRALFAAIEASEQFAIQPGELSVVFVDDSEIARVHADFMNDATATDVITFQADPAMQSAGEIIVSVDHARNRSKEFGVPFSRELSLYLIHGWLHLAGYDDRSESDRAQMRAAEQSALALLDEANLTHGFSLAY
ncbi:MAG: rRNA maturation RNase YbeY [Opitutales bacterium]|jgi:probable rRNA maturation factor